MPSAARVSLTSYGTAVASVAPGFSAMDGSRPAWRGGGFRIVTQSPFGRVAEAAEVAVAVQWLASPAADRSSGTTLVLNGAPHLRR
ncbi:hypothetical protein [Streptomyces sp. McG3]|uniref:hypothetical protein n=1 Tax=unclassified Streptomyces TaxID=2593676 RepID=UPI001BE9CC01|nr:hypothetical protein [Streptomyces sp. McG3]MBT2899701.1 hypothetical protein [Streptomyces sp. McG3]